MRLIRNPDLLLRWNGADLLVEDLRHKRSSVVTSGLVAVLSCFNRELTPDEAVARMPAFERRSLRRSIDQLAAAGLLMDSRAAARRPSLVKSWKSNLASAFYHSASRDCRYAKGRLATERLLEVQVVPYRRPAAVKRYAARGLRRLPTIDLEGATGELGRVLDARRTVRSFARRPVALADFSVVVNGTWGQTGWIDGGPLGPLVVKRSPSAGALHPIECYALVWNVDGLAPGLYHYDVAASGLRLLKRGDFRSAAVDAASGQRWVGRAAFVCIMTAVLRRTLWKYDNELAFKVLWLDAGHLAQTFCLLATARGLGPFQTAAIQDSYIEELIGLDGIKEFPVYLCGAGVPAP